MQNFVIDVNDIIYEFDTVSRNALSISSDVSRLLDLKQQSHTKTLHRFGLDYYYESTYTD